MYVIWPEITFTSTVEQRVGSGSEKLRITITLKSERASKSSLPANTTERVKCRNFVIYELNAHTHLRIAELGF